MVTNHVLRLATGSLLEKRIIIYNNKMRAFMFYWNNRMEAGCRHKVMGGFKQKASATMIRARCFFVTVAA